MADPVFSKMTPNGKVQNSFLITLNIGPHDNLNKQKTTFF